jgi:hypothetical protein
MSLLIPPSLRSKRRAFALCLFTAAISLVACSGKPQSFAEYISDICSRSFRSSSPDAAFLAENASAMTKMMIDMRIQPSGDVDNDFVATMTPHHQGAIAMARAELRYGHNEQLRRLAQEIIVTQQEEIAAMRLALDPPRAPSAPSSGQVSSAGKIDSRLSHSMSAFKEH